MKKWLYNNRNPISVALLGALFLYPFYTRLINHLFGLDLGPLYTFGLESKEFITVWIALGGVVGVAVNIFLTRERISKQEEQFNEQQKLQREQQELQQKQFNEQSELQLKEQRDARFASGVELLGNPHESTRIGGAYNLYFLARDFAEFRAPVCEILCAHLRSIAHKDKFWTYMPFLNPKEYISGEKTVSPIESDSDVKLDWKYRGDLKETATLLERGSKRM